LFGAEEGVEHGLAGALAEHQRDRRAEDPEQDQPAETALALARGTQPVGGLAQVLGRVAEVLLHLLVAGDGLDRALAVAGGPTVGAARRVEGLTQAVAQLFVLDQLLHVGVFASRRVKVPGAIRGLTRLRLRHASLLPLGRRLPSQGIPTR